MISAKLMNDLRKEGFRLIFPSYDSNESRIIDILREENERLNLSIPLLLQNRFNYNKIISKLSNIQKKTFSRIIIITNKIFQLEKIDDAYLKEIIMKNKIKTEIREEEFNYYYESFKDSIRNLEGKKEEKIKRQVKFRGDINTKKALSEIYSPGKIRILNKIFSHEKLTNSELKYYYRSIRPLIKAILNEDMQDYIRAIESTKKYVET